MSDNDTTTPETTAAPTDVAQTTPVTEQEPAPEVVAASGAAPLESSASDAPAPEPASSASETLAAAAASTSAPESDLPEPTPENTIDLATVQFDEVFKHLIQQTKQFAFHLIVTCGLLEQIHLRDNPPAAEPTEPAPADAPVAEPAPADAPATA
jgi:hypothetical protein